MALTRKALKAMGLTDEQIDSVVEMHTETVDGLKAEVAKYKPDAEKLSEVQRELDELKTAGDGGYKEKYEKEHEAFENFKTQQTAKETRNAKEKAYRELLKSLNVSEKRIDTIIKVTDLDAIELDGEKVKDAETHSESIKTEWADFIVSSEISGADTHNPPPNEEGNTNLGALSMADYIAARKKQ